MTGLSLALAAFATCVSPRIRDLARRAAASGVTAGLVYVFLSLVASGSLALLGAGLGGLLLGSRLATPGAWPWTRLAAALVAACAFGANAAAVLHVPVLGVWLLAIAGGAELGWLLTGLVAGAGLAHGLGLGLPAAWAVLVACCAVARALHGPEGLWLEPGLRDGQDRGRSARRAGPVDVLFVAPDPRQRATLRRALGRRGLAAEELLGGTLACRLEARLLAGLTRPGAQLRFGSLAGVRAFDGGRAVDLPIPAAPTRPGSGLGLAELSRRLRTARNGQPLGPTCIARSVRVGIMDTGLSARGAVGRQVVARVDFTDGGRRDPHGDAVARVLLAVAGEAQLVDVRVLGPSGSGSLLAVLRGLDHCEREFRAGRLDLVNMSLGGACLGDCPLCRALRATTVPTTSAAGNAGRAVSECPGTSPHTLGVAALTVCGTRVAEFSGRGRCAAYGEDLRVGRRLVSGTSVAAPVVAGVLALAVEARRSAGAPPLARDDAFAVVLAEASRDGVASTDRDACGAGLVNAAEVWRRCAARPTVTVAARRKARPLAA